MKITSVKINNYKSIKSIEFVPSPKVNVLIGENSVGKSNIFDAITWLIGPVYPSFNSVSKEDRFKGKDTNKIDIAVGFDNENTLRLSEEWIDRGGRTKSGLSKNEGDYINTEERETYVSSFIGIDRKISDYLPSNKWSLMGRILQDVNDRFSKEEIINEETGEVINKSEDFKNKLIKLRDEYLFSVIDEDGENIMQKFVDVLQKETAQQLNKPEDEFKVDLNLYDPWNFYRTLQLSVFERDMNLDFRASELGMGVQASITIAILKAYSKLKLKNNTPIFIDEPELFLHPHGRRNFYKIIRELADNGTQIFLTTHSTEFIDLSHFEEIFLVRKDSEKGTYISNADPQKFITDLRIRKDINSNEAELKLSYQNAYENTGDSQKASEAMFAKKVILVEGESESLILPYFFKLLNYDYIAKGISIVRCGGKSELDRFYRLYAEFGIPCYIIFDVDANHIGTEDEAATIEKNKDILCLFESDFDDFPDTTVDEKYACFHTNFNDYLGMEVSCNTKGLKLYKKVKTELDTVEKIPEWVLQLIEKIEELPFEVESCLLE